jgi:threonine dehydrogenase-like Zn-dependent dehydrogenase
VSTIDPSLTGRWNKERRLASAWEAIRWIRPGRLITHRVPFSRAADAYKLIAESPAQTIQVMLVHESTGNPPLAPG